MSIEDEVKELLIEIRDNQRESIKKQDEHLEIAKKLFERSNTQITESIDLQRQAVDKAKVIFRVALPGVIVCLVLILYLIIKYF